MTTRSEGVHHALVDTGGSGPDTIGVETNRQVAFTGNDVSTLVRPAANDEVDGDAVRRFSREFLASSPKARCGLLSATWRKIIDTTGTAEIEGLPERVSLRRAESQVQITRKCRVT